MIREMSDSEWRRPDHSCLFDIASEQHGYFSVQQAHACGFSWRVLLHHAKSGRFIHIRRGLYRLRDYPSSPREEVVAAWLSAGKDEAVVSHDSALDLLDLSDVIPNSVHLIVPRARRGLNPPPGTTVHTATQPLRSDEVMTVDGVRVTAAARTIADAAEAGTGPEQIELAIAQAMERGMATPEELDSQTSARSRRVRELIAGAAARARRAEATPSEKAPA